MIERARKAGRMARSLVTGAAATLVDLTVLVLLVAGFGVGARYANPASLFAGALVQFVGGRHFAFRAPRGHVPSHPLAKQLIAFAAVELLALTINGLGFDFIAARHALDATAAVLARAIVSTLVYWCWCYPLWRIVFASEPASASGS